VNRRRPPRRESRAGSALVGLGFLTVLTVAFVAGVVVGRHNPRFFPSLGGAAAAKEPRRGTDGRLADRAKPVEPAPVLTFYQELTAPLTSPPPATKPRSDHTPSAPMEKENASKFGEARGRARAPSQPAVGRTTPEAAATTDRADHAATTLPSASAAAVTSSPTIARYTVQVGAFKQRDEAEAVRARLAAAGHDAFIADLDGAATTWYRVRVGAYGSRDEALRAAERLTANGRFATYVTVR
jgi:DedD protein